MKPIVKASMLKAALLALGAGVVCAGCTGCGSKGASDEEKAQGQVPKDVMQKTYQDKAGRPSQ